MIPTLYYAPQTRALRALWMLEELAVPHELVALDLRAGEHRTESYKAINPAAKVPALAIEGGRVFESAAICAYLADRYPDKGLAPAADDPARGEYLSWMFYAVGQIEPAFTDHTRSLEANVRIAWQPLERVLDVLSDAVTPGPWILGERFSGADVMVGSMLAWAAQQGLLEEAQTTLHAYCARLLQRPAFQAALRTSRGD